DRLRQLAEAEDVKNFFRVHNDFHELFIRASGNATLFELITNLVKKFQRLRIASLSLPGRMDLSVREHEKIIDAFRRRAADQAEKLVRKNAEEGGRVLMEKGDSPVRRRPQEEAAAAE
ncbi:MAG TPA: FCD domain-containing protein, partial [Verrucomicrobiae bacterium]|nr:FCD domain-containing protein [Verrucomicrobiae bacterium]